MPPYSESEADNWQLMHACLKWVLYHWKWYVYKTLYRQAKPKFFRCFVGSGPKFQWKKSWRPKILIKHLSLHFSGNISCPLSVCYLSSVKSEKNNPPRHHLALLSTSHEMCVLILKVMPPAVMVYCCFRHFLVLSI